MSQYKRKREGKTDYKRRLLILKSDKIRFVVRKSLNNILLQFVKYDPDGDKIVVSAHSNILKKYGWDLHKGNIPAAYLTGLLAGKLAKEKGVKEAVTDIGLSKSIKGSVQYATVKGAIDSGINIPCSEEVIPIKDKLNGKSLGDDINKKFEEVKIKIIGGKNNGK